METHILNKKQQNSSLSAKRARSKITIKNVVASPFNNFYWPELQAEDFNTLIKILEENIPRVVTNCAKSSWSDLEEKFKLIPKNKRLDFRKEHIKDFRKDVHKDNRKGLVLGINDVTKLLEKNLAAIVLISDDVQPKLMVQHVIDQCVLYKIPVLILKDLRSLLKRVCGVGSTVLGIKKDINPESKLSLIKEATERIFEKCVPPIDHINYNRSKEFQYKSDIQQKNGILCENKKPLTHIKPMKNINDNEIKNRFYLRRQSNSSRVFVPNFVEKNIENEAMEVDTSVFLAFPDRPMSVKKIKNKGKSHYRSLVVKRLKGNPNRNKRKIENIKSKRKQ